MNPMQVESEERILTALGNLLCQGQPEVKDLAVGMDIHQFLAKVTQGYIFWPARIFPTSS